MPEKGFRLPQSSYEELVKIIKAYGRCGDKASLSEVAKTAAINETIISRNNAFLTSVGLIEGGRVKRTTSTGRALANALHHNVSDEISLHWRDIVLGNEFLQKMVSAVSIRQGMETVTLQGHIAYSAGEPKTAAVSAGAGAVVEILKVAGLLNEQDGKLVALEVPTSQPRQQAPPVAEGGAPKVTYQVAEHVIPAKGAAPVGISIQIQIQCSASEIQDLGPKLRALLRELSKPSEPGEPSTSG